MGATRDFVTATLADALLPTFRRPVEDIIYETLDRRQIPTRTDFKEMRDLLNNLRGQVSGTATGVRKIVERSEDAEETLAQLETRLAALAEEHSLLHQQLAQASLLRERLDRLEARLDAFDTLTAEQIDERIARALDALQPPPPTEEPEEADEPDEPDEAEEEVVGGVAPAAEVLICKIEKCGGEERARGFCARHYQRWRRGGLKKTHISLEGEVQIAGKVRRVDAQYAGDPYTVLEGGESVQVGAAVVPLLPLG